MNATRLAVMAGAAGSVAIMLRVGQRNDSTIPLILLVLFTGWVLSPFVALLLAERVWKRRPRLTQKTLHRLMLIVTLGSLAIYGYVALSPPRPKPASVFLLVPLGSWLLMGMALGIAARVAALAMLFSTACGRTAQDAATTTTRDSLGILIVENPAPSRTGAPWTLDTVAVIDLGGQSADPYQEFSGFVHPVRLTDGRLVVANGGSNQLRIFGSEGRWQKSVGRQGSGPGEFEQLGWLDAGTGDTLRTYDWSLQRYSIFSSDGAFLRPVMLRSTGESASARPVGVLADGRLIVQRQNFVTPNSKPGVGRDTLPLQIYDATGNLNDSLGRFPGPEHLIQTGKGSVSVSSLPFGKELFVVVHGSRLYVGASDGPEIQVKRPDGVTERIVRWRTTPVAVSPADIEAYIAAATEGWPPGREERRDRFVRMLREAPFPKWKPSYAGLLVGPEGSIWVRRYTEPDRAASTRFEVFDSAGAWLGDVAMPAGYAPTQITPGFVVGTWQDADEVRHVRMYRLVPRR